MKHILLLPLVFLFGCHTYVSTPICNSGNQLAVDGLDGARTNLDKDEVLTVKQESIVGQYRVEYKKNGKLEEVNSLHTCLVKGDIVAEIIDQPEGTKTRYVEFKLVDANKAIHLKMLGVPDLNATELGPYKIQQTGGAFFKTALVLNEENPAGVLDYLEILKDVAEDGTAKEVQLVLVKNSAF